jgi:hypothetical protein
MTPREASKASRPPTRWGRSASHISRCDAFQSRIARASRWFKRSFVGRAKGRILVGFKTGRTSHSSSSRSRMSQYPCPSGSGCRGTGWQIGNPLSSPSRNRRTPKRRCLTRSARPFITFGSETSSLFLSQSATDGSLAILPASSRRSAPGRRFSASRRQSAATSRSCWPQSTDGLDINRSFPNGPRVALLAELSCPRGCPHDGQVALTDEEESIGSIPSPFRKENGGESTVLGMRTVSSLVKDRRAHTPTFF